MSLLPPFETNSLERELNFLKQTIGSLREQLERNLDLHDTELQSLEEEHKNKEAVLQNVISEMRADYERFSENQEVESK